jgi:hypothetical protein
MKRIVLWATIIVAFNSCGSETPVQYFNTAALNCNLIAGFGSRDIDQYLTYKPAVYNPQTKKSDTITFKENIQKYFLANVEANYNKVKALKLTGDTKQMVESSLALYAYVLPKYKTEFMAIAQMRDENKPKSEVDNAIAEFVNKYGDEFSKKYSAFLDIALAYAKKNNIDVKTF